ncbi:hypothetical protein D9M72_552960 [compost metagenome]
MEDGEQQVTALVAVKRVLDASVKAQVSAEAKKKPLATTTPAELGVDVASRLTTLQVVEPPKRGAGIKVPDVAALIGWRPVAGIRPVMRVPHRRLCNSRGRAVQPHSTIWHHTRLANLQREASS